jgi:thioredoxin-dependent peroxiredoxin
VTRSGAQVVAISTDSVATQKRFKAEYQLPYPVLSDPGGKVSKGYGGTIPVVGLANRATYVVAPDGKIQEIVTGSAAIDPSSAIAQCSAPKKGDTP